MRRRILFIILDLVFVLLAFLLMAWIKPATRATVLPFYFESFLVFLAFWLVASFVTGKYSFKAQYKLKGSLVSILISNATVTAIVTTLIYFYSLFSYSRLIVFGTIILATVFEVIMTLISNSILRATNIDSPDSIDRLLVEGNKRDLSIVPQHVAEAVKKNQYKGGGEIPVQMQDLIKSEYGEEVYQFILQFATPDIGLKSVVSTSSRFNILALSQSKYDCLINLQRVNDIQHVNKFFEAVNKRLNENGIFIGKAETSSQRKTRILKKYITPLNYTVYSIDFIFKRVFPKVPGLKKIYFGVTKGRSRLLSRAETLGRLYSCGFAIVDEQQIGNQLYFVAKKTGEPLFPKNPTYGPLVKLKRVGKDGKVFGVYKMRTMHPYSEYLQDYVYEKNSLQEGGKFKDDFRISTLGKIMRKVWLDEVPMFINVLKGEMKIVGVRPLSKHYFELYSDELKEKRVKHKPGLIPPFYADMPKTLTEIMASEMRYLNEYEKHPLRTDLKYFFKAWENIVFKRARSN